jgi:site-specific recombinase XerD
VLGKGRRPRALPIGRKTAQALDRYLRTREGHRLAHLPHAWVGRNRPMTPSGVYQVVHDRARAAGLPAMHPISSGTPSPPAGWPGVVMRMS